MKIWTFIKKLFINPDKSKKFIEEFMQIGHTFKINDREAAIVLKEDGVKFYLPDGYPDDMENVNEDILITIEYLLHAAHRDDWKLEFAEMKLKQEKNIEEDYIERRATFEIIEGGKNDDDE